MMKPPAKITQQLSKKELIDQGRCILCGRKLSWAIRSLQLTSAARCGNWKDCEARPAVPGVEREKKDRV